MDIQFTEEQDMLRSSVERLLRNQYDFEARRKIVASPPTATKLSALIQ